MNPLEEEPKGKKNGREEAKKIIREMAPMIQHQASFKSLKLYPLLPFIP
jgi:hypothetical protein